MKKSLIAILALLLCIGVFSSLAACKKKEPPAEEKYTITWTVGGTALETDSNVTKGTKPSFDGATPTKAATAQYSYTFAGWATTEGQETGSAEAALSAVTANTTFYAAFSKTTNSYNVQWVVDSENVLETDASALYGTAPSFDGATPTKAATAQYTYTFAGWATSEGQETGSAEAALSNVIGNATFYAAFSKTTNSYNVQWVVDSENVLETDASALYGTAPSFDGATPTKTATAEYSYTFEGWATSEGQETGSAVAALSTVTGNTTFYAAFSKIVSVQWVINSENILETDSSVPYGTKPSFDGATPTKDATANFTYTFAGWATTEGQMTGAALENLPEATANVIYYAAFSKATKSFTVQWVVTSENILETDVNVYYGATPSFDGTETPTREQSAQYTYNEFTGWATEPDQETGVAASELAPVVDNVTYYAAFSRTIRCYNLWWSEWSTYEGRKETRVIISYHSSKGTALPYGTSPLPYDAPEPTKESDLEYDYTFMGWAADAIDANLGINYVPYEQLPPLTGHTHYCAVFTKSPRNYTVVWMSYDGTVELERDENVAFGTQMIFNQDNPTMAGYTFTGWAPFAEAQYGATTPYVNWTNANADTGIARVYAAFQPNEE